MENQLFLEFELFLNSLVEKSRINLLPALIEAQRIFRFIPEEAAILIGKKLKVPAADIYGVIEFYSLLYTKPTAETVIRICKSPLCSQKGSEKIKKALLEKLSMKEGIPSSDKRFMVESVHCLGLCTNAPSALVNEKPVCNISENRLDELIEGKGAKPLNRAFSNSAVITKRFRSIDPSSIEDFIIEGGFSGFLHSLTMDKNSIIETVKSSGLLGRGGAAFPTGLKGESTSRKKNSEIYVVCNADESEPGTFKDRVLLNNDPFSVLEGMLITAYAIGSQKGYIYIRGEYYDVKHLFNQILQTAREKNFLGDNIQNSGFSFDIEIRSGVGAYICGEETALFESIEGKRGYPRNKPPYPVESGLFGKPTTINNVETFCYISHIINNLKMNYNDSKLPSPSGTRLFCLSGDVARSGLYELPFGIKLNELIYDWGGGIRNNNKIKTIILGGASGSFVPEEHWNIALDQKSLKEAGLSMGSGVIMVFDDTTEIPHLLHDITSFFNHESCGKCYPCQLGSRKQHEIITRIRKSGPREGDLTRLEDIGLTMKDASLCGLGQTASTAVLSALKLWPELFGGSL
ncbi:MAG: NAD(P)H-dependent oxidoreductase subunit E [Spirochaetaceae bacterium]|jgi:NADH-quinone oxidoreductase subunit F|nr:NAD(P)H-dependent oxidoreductase subunit E [Spirochaetaceae bacterium]